MYIYAAILIKKNSYQFCKGTGKLCKEVRKRDMRMGGGRKERGG